MKVSADGVWNLWLSGAEQLGNGKTAKGSWHPWLDVND